MHSQQITAWGAPLEGRDLPTPKPRGSEVLLRIHACGVCHTDLHIWQGYFDLGDGKRSLIEDRGVRLPFTMGHEIVGEVVAVGPEASGVKVGDQRIVYPWIGCGTCNVCKRGLDLLCVTPRIIGTWKDGGYADHVIVPHARYLVAFDGLDPALACTYACSGITAWSALAKTGATRADDPVLILGAGGVGLNAIYLAPALVAGPVAIGDPDPAKRAAAEAAGAAWTFDNTAPDAAEAVRRWSNGGVAAVVDLVGRPETARFGIDVLRKGGTLVMVGLFGGAITLPLPWLPAKMISLRGSYVGTLDDLKGVVAMAQGGRLPALPVARRPLAEANAALTDLAAGRVVGRVVLNP